MLITLDGISSLLKPVQYANAGSPISVTVFGIITDFKFLHPWNRLLGKDVNPSSIITFTRLLQPENVPPPNPTTLYHISSVPCNAKGMYNVVVVAYSGNKLSTVA